jgi:hypothetical protein
MNARVKKQDANNISFDAKLKEAIFAIDSMPWQAKIDLYHKVIDICRTQVYDCVDGVIEAYFLALHDVFGFGGKRLQRLVDAGQAIIDDVVDKYDIGTVYKLRRELEERRIKYMLHTERAQK